MANVIKHKRGSGSDPSASNLVIGELAIRTDNGKLFTKMDSGAIAEIAGGGSDIAINTLSSSSATGGGSATFNGSAYRFTLSSPPSVSAQQLLVSVNGVVQKPVAGTGQPSEGYSVDGSDIIFGDAPATGADFFILTFRSLGVSEPADNSVTSAKIVDGAIVNADINASAAIAGTKISPNFGSQNIVTTGNCGLGTTSPTALLNVNTPASGTTTAIQISRTTHGNVGKFINNTGALEIQSNKQLILSSDPDQGMTAAGSMIQFDVDGGTKAVIDASGNVGINDTSPRAELSVAAVSGNAPHIDIGQAASNNFKLGYDSGHCILGAAASAGDFIFKNNVNSDGHPGGSGTELMRIDSSGDTEINSENDKGLFVKTDGNNAAVRLRATGGSDSGGFRLNHNAPNSLLLFDRISSNGVFASTLMALNSSGNLGIGTTDPGGNKVLVQLGDANTNGFRVKGGSGQGRTTFALQAGNTTSTASTSYRLMDSSGDTVASLFFANNTDDLQISTAKQGGEILFNTSSTANSSGSVNRARFDMNGNFFLGKNSSDRNNTGVELMQNGFSGFTRNNGTVFFCNRGTNNGTLISLRRSNSEGGTISVTTTSAAFNSNSSDRSLKKNFENWTENTLDLFKNLNPQKFNYIIEEDGAQKTKGYIAQDLVDSFPEAYPKNDDDKYMFNPSGMVVYLMKALQEAVARIEALEAK